jgi:DNA-binding NarL/FixJ family response regulator
MSPSVLVVDDHPALRAGLRAVFEQEPGLVFAGAVATEREVPGAIDIVRPDVVLLDYALGRGDGLRACFELKQRPGAPGVVLYTAYADDALAVPAAIAQADALVAKSAPVDELLHAIYAVAGGRVLLEHPEPERIEAASSRLKEGDLPVVGMLFARVPVADIAATLGVGAGEVRSRALRVLGAMQAADRIRGARAATG